MIGSARKVETILEDRRSVDCDWPGDEYCAIPFSLPEWEGRSRLRMTGLPTEHGRGWDDAVGNRYC